MSEANRWKLFYDRTRATPPHPLLVQAVAFVEGRTSALDLGSGALNEAIFLLEQGFERVTAVDKTPMAREIADTLPPDRFEYAIRPFEEFDFFGRREDLISAQYSLPFIAPANFGAIFGALVSSLKSGGVFAGQFFGDRDSWCPYDRMTCHTLQQARHRLSGLEILAFDEIDEDGSTATGETKHWHVFDIIARKP